jgi:uncharacterized damage-inducible protein DinB
MSHHGQWVPPAEDPRGNPTPSRGERAVLEEYLEHYRQTLAMKCEGLSPAQLATRSVPPSALSLLGLVRHLARVEQSWFRRVIEGDHELVRHFDAPGEDGGFALPDEVDDGVVAEAMDLWQAEVAHAREVLAAVPLDRLVEVHGEQHEVRDLVVHMIEEYARHVGHADLLRECIDGRTGQ